MTNPESGHNPEQEKVNVEMKDLVARTKLSLEYAIVDLELRLKYGWDAKLKDNAEWALERSSQVSDDDPDKSSDIEDAKQMIASAQNWKESATATLNFLKEVYNGNLPENWSDVPDWSMHKYPYEGIYRHAVVRNQAFIDILKRRGIDLETLSEEERTKAITDQLIDNDDFLIEQARE